MKKVFLFVLVGVCATTVSVNAQTQKVVADKIASQVGDKIILRSDILTTVADMKRQAAGQEGAVVPTECQVLESQLIRKALLLQAQKDSLSISEDELDNDLENRIRMYIRQYNGKEVLEEIAGKTIYQIKEDFREPIREQKLSEQMQRKIVENIKITPNEVKTYFNSIPTDSLPFYESEVEVSQIIVHPKANKDVEDYVSKQMLDYKKQAESGAQKFEQLQKLYSEDPGFKQPGGEFIQLNRNDKNMWDPAFLSAVFRLKEGQISPVVKSAFGLHIIQMVSRNGDEAIVRHILRIPPITDEEINVAKVHLDSIRTQIMAGKLAFNEAVSKYSDDEGSKFSAGSISAGQDGNTFLTMDQLDKDMIGLFKEQNLQTGQYSKPQVFTDERGRQQVRMVYLRNRTEPHRENLKEDYNRVATRALEEKKNKALEKWFDSHVPNMYITIDKEFMGCPELKEWKVAAEKTAQASN